MKHLQISTIMQYHVIVRCSIFGLSKKDIFFFYSSSGVSTKLNAVVLEISTSIIQEKEKIANENKRIEYLLFFFCWCFVCVYLFIQQFFTCLN